MEEVSEEAAVVETTETTENAAPETSEATAQSTSNSSSSNNFDVFQWANNIDEIKDKTDKLTEQFHTISAKLYQQAQAQQQAGGAGFDPNMAGGFNPNMGGAGFNPGAGAGPQGAPNDNVVDADFEVVDEDK